MSTPDNLQKLAITAFESENYELAYDYFNRLLENDLENPQNWLMKSYCAAHLSRIDKMLDKEVLMSLKTAIAQSNYSEAEITEIANKLSTILFEKIKESLDFIKNEMDVQFNALQIPTGTLYAVNEMRKLPIQMRTWSKYNEKLFQYFKLMDYVVRLKPTVISCEKGYRSVNYTALVTKNSGDQFYKLEGDSIESKLLRDLKQFSKIELEKNNPNNEVTNPKSNSGCFIATAATGDYNNPIVMDLRIFRDNWLLKRDWGVEFTRWYYTHGPKAANIIEKSIILKRVTYYLIVKPLHLITKRLK
jgi:hypothetical protein